MGRNRMRVPKAAEIDAIGTRTEALESDRLATYAGSR
jgi:hypothetical protein